MLIESAQSADESSDLPAQALADPRTNRLTGVRRWIRAHPAAVTVACTLVVGLALVVGLWGKRDAFVGALGDAPAWMLAGAALLQLIWLVARSEAWHVCVD